MGSGVAGKKALAEAGHAFDIARFYASGETIDRLVVAMGGVVIGGLNDVIGQECPAVGPAAPCCFAHPLLIPAPPQRGWRV